MIAECRRRLDAGEDGQALVAAIRPHVLALWQGADDAEPLRFARHLRSLWDVSLHVAVPPSFAVVADARARLAERRLSCKACLR